METFVNDQVDVQGLPRWEAVSFERVSRKYRYVIMLNYLVLAVIFGSLGTGVLWANELSTADPVARGVGVGLLLVIVLLCTLHLWSYTSWGYALRQKDVLYRSGIITKRVEIVPYRHIQHVQVKEGAFSRLFALVSIEVFTAGSGKSIQIPGIPREDSRRIQAYISDRISQTEESELR